MISGLSPVGNVRPSFGLSAGLCGGAATASYWCNRRGSIRALQDCNSPTPNPPNCQNARTNFPAIPLVRCADTISAAFVCNAFSLSLSPSEVVILRSPRATFAPTFPDVTHPSPFMKCRGEGELPLQYPACLPILVLVHPALIPPSDFN